MTVPTQSERLIPFTEKQWADHFREKAEVAEAEVKELREALWAMRDAWVSRQGEDSRLWPTDVLKALQPLGGAW